MPLLAAMLGFVASASLLLAQPAEDRSAEAELASFTVLPEFEVNLFASEANGVVKPIQIRFDPRGRLWVIGSTVYPQLEPGQKPDDKILILEDTDRDGRADKTTVFADGLMIPTGIELGHGGVYLGHGTDLLFLKDTDGDDKADEREVLFRGFGTGDNHQNINSFTFGPGGELWMCQGLHTHSNVETAYGIKRLHKAGIWRLRPLLGKLEGFYGSEFEPQNPWGYVFTRFGEPILIAGNNSSIIYPVPGLTRDHKDLAPKLIWKNGQGRKCSGADLVETAHFPEGWQGKIITGGYINNAVWVLNVREDGSGYALDDSPPLIRSSSRNFRPVDVKFGPDGALYVCDWFNPIIGHYQASFRHPDRDKKHGRIWRVTAKGRKLTTPPKLAKASTSKLVEHLSSADGWTRRFAKRALADRSREEVIKVVGKWGASPKRTALELKEALGVLQSHEAPNRELLEQALASPEPGLRAYAASLIGHWADQMRDTAELLERVVADAHPRVRLQAVVSASYAGSARAVAVALRALDQPVDDFLQYALQQTIYALKPQWSGALRAGELKLPQPHLAWLVRADGTADTLEALRGLVRGDSAQSAGLRLVLAEVGNAEDFELLLKHPGLTAATVRAIEDSVRTRKIAPTTASGAEVKRLAAKSDPEMRAAAFGLGAQWKIKGVGEIVSKLAREPEGGEIRLAAIEVLPAFEGGLDLLQGLAGSSAESAEVRAGAIAGLVRLNAGEAAKQAVVLADTSADPKAWETIFAAFLSREGAAEHLAAALKARTVPAGIIESGKKLMNNSGRRPAGLVAALENNSGTTRTVTPELIKYVRERGDSVRGRAVYERAELGCVACHQVKGEGGRIGPDLGALGSAQPIDFIIGALLDPQKEVKEGFVSTRIVTKSEEEFQGYITRETASELTLRDVLQNREVVLAKGDIAARKQSGSVMPAGLVDGLSDADFADLIKYLSELGTNVRK